MSRNTLNAVPANGPAHTISVGAPKDNVSATINIPPDSHLNLDFDPTAAEYSRQGTDLVVAFPEEDRNGNVLEDKSPLGIAENLAGHSHMILDTNGNDYAQAHDASLGSLFTLAMGDGNDALLIGNLDSLNDTDVSNCGLGLSQLDGILNGFEALDMTGGAGTSLRIDMNGLDWLGIDSGDGSIFTGDELFDVTVLGSDNVLLVKGDSVDHGDVSGSNWNATGSTITADNIAYDVYSNSLNEYTLIQQIVSVTSY